MPPLWTARSGLFGIPNPLVAVFAADRKNVLCGLLGARLLLGLLPLPLRHASDQTTFTTLRGHWTAPINWRKDSCCVSVDGLIRPAIKDFVNADELRRGQIGERAVRQQRMEMLSKGGGVAAQARGRRPHGSADPSTVHANRT